MRFTDRLEAIGARPSIGTVADSFDPALAETTNGLPKAECVYGPDANGWDEASHLELATLSWVAWFNQERLHGHRRDLPPAEFEATFYAAKGPTSHWLESRAERLHRAQGGSIRLRGNARAGPTSPPARVSAEGFGDFVQPSAPPPARRRSPGPVPGARKGPEADREPAIRPSRKRPELVLGVSLQARPDKCFRGRRVEELAGETRCVHGGMHVTVGEARHHRMAAEVDDANGRRVAGASGHLGDPSVPDEDLDSASQDVRLPVEVVPADDGRARIIDADGH